MLRLKGEDQIGPRATAASSSLPTVANERLLLDHTVHFVVGTRTTVNPRDYPGPNPGA